MKSFLAQIPLFRAISPARLNTLEANAELRRFRKGEVLFTEGQPAEAVWLVQRGWVYLVKRTPQGTPVTIFTVTPEEILCGFSAVVGQSAYYASAVAATHITALCLPRETFAHLLKHQPGFAEQVLVIYHTRMRHMAEAITLSCAPVEQRLAYVLLRLRTTFGKVVPVTHQELARMIGARWETSIRTVAALRRRGWLSTSRGKITILHPDRLKALLSSSA